MLQLAQGRTVSSGTGLLASFRTMIEREVFRPLKDIQIFMETCTVMNDTLAWDIGKNRDNTTCLDIDPDTLYELPFVKENIA